MEFYKGKIFDGFFGTRVSSRIVESLLATSKETIDPKEKDRQEFDESLKKYPLKDLSVDKEATGIPSQEDPLNPFEF